MGKTSQKLTIWVARDWAEHEKINELRAKGHAVEILMNLPEDDPDLILHPAAHQWTNEMWIYMEQALKTARRRKYPRARKKA